MTPSSPVFRVASTTASAAVLAITVGLFPAGPAAADSPEPTPMSTTSPEQCFLLFCGPGPAGDQGPAEPTRTQKPTKQPENPPAPSMDPVPAPPEQPAPSVATPAVDPVPAAPSAVPEETAGSPAAHTSAAGAVSSPPPTGASSGQDWNTPVTRSAQASRVAAVTPGRDPGSGDPAFLPIIAGVLLLGAAGASFIWWGRNRFRPGAH
jgi:outer membrane biosynthesis protein TonB